jgi:hypothetical protein
MIPSKAIGVRLIGEYSDHAAFRDSAASTFLHHPRQFFFQHPEPVDPVTHLGQMLARDHIDLGAGPIRVICQRQQGPNTVERESEFAAVPDKGQSVRMSLGVGAMVARRARCPGHEPAFS